MQKYTATKSEAGSPVKKGRSNYKSNILHAKKDKRRAEAEMRQLKFDDLTDSQKLARIRSRPGHSRKEVIYRTSKTFPNK